MPLSGFEPAAYLHKAALAGGWKQWRADTNVQGDPLTAGDREYGWGFGVHAHAELHFDLPPSARAFRSLLALDRAADDGGCVKAKAYFGAVQPTGALPNRALYESPPIVGSAKPLDTGRLELRPQPGA
ncbi:MAG: NPCBM/NEW2 domain-containing protein [Pirellulales bacterium]